MTCDRCQQPAPAGVRVPLCYIKGRPKKNRRLCPPCARYATGLCQDCNNERAGLSPHCERCRTKKVQQWQAKAYRDHADERRNYRRDRYRNPDVHARALEYAKERRAAQPRTDLDRLYDRLKARRHRARKRQQRTAA